MAGRTYSIVASINRHDLRIEPTDSGKGMESHCMAMVPAKLIRFAMLHCSLLMEDHI